MNEMDITTLNQTASLTEFLPNRKMCELDTDKEKKVNELRLVKTKEFKYPVLPTLDENFFIKFTIFLPSRIAKQFQADDSIQLTALNTSAIKNELCIHYLGGKWLDEMDEPQSSYLRDEVPLKFVMNPHGKILDIQGIQALGEEPNISSRPSNAEKFFDIVRDLNNQKGRGAEIFAKRKKRSEKWVVDNRDPIAPPHVNSEKSQVSPHKMDNRTRENSNSTHHSISSFSNSTKHTDENIFPAFCGLDIPFNNSSAPHKVIPHDKNMILNIGRKIEPEMVQIYLDKIAVNAEPEYAKNGHHNQNDSLFKKLKSSESNQQAESYPTDWDINRYPQRNPIFEYNKNSDYHRKHQENINKGDEDYTPIPVKQLIQEFEKTCRPMLQYKKINSKIPVIQNHSLENISRFFDLPRIPNKYNNVRDSSQFLLNGRGIITNIYSDVDNPENTENCMRNHPRNNLIGLRYEYDSTDDEINDSLDESSSSGSCTKINLLSNGKSSPENYDYCRELFDSSPKNIYDAQLNFRHDDFDPESINAGDTSFQAESSILAEMKTPKNLQNRTKKLHKTTVLKILNSDQLANCSNEDLYKSVYNGPKISSFQSLINFNTAPRGWNQSQSYYRPVTFSKLQEPMSYSDF